MNKKCRIISRIFMMIAVFVMMSCVCVKELSAADSITLDQVKEIALEHAAVDETDVVFSKEKRDKGVYELKFSNASGKYEYTISAVDGQILNCEWDIENEPSEELSLVDALSTETIEGSISKEQACQTALEDAGINAENLKYITCYVEWCQHKPYAYEVKFAENVAPYQKYHYRIELYTGDILEGCCIPSKQSDKQDVRKAK